MEGSYKQLRSIWEPRGVHFVRETNFAQQLKNLVRGLCKVLGTNVMMIILRALKELTLLLYCNMICSCTALSDSSKH